MILTDSAITNALNQTVQKIREGDLEQTQAGLAVLEFHRLMRPMRDSIKGPRQFFDPVREFGPERVHETGDHISRCIAAFCRLSYCAADRLNIFTIREQSARDRKRVPREQSAKDY